MTLTRPFTLSLCALALLTGSVQAGPASTLVNASFVDGAQIVTGTPELADFAAALRQVAADAGAGCQKSEYVVWNSQAGLEAQFRQRLTGLGYSFTVLRTVDDDGHFVSFQAKKAQGSLVGIWADVDGTTLLGWCTLAVSKPAPAATAAPPAASGNRRVWPAFGTFRAGDLVQVYTPTGWRKVEVIEVGVQPGQRGNFEKQYVVNTPGQRTWNDFYAWGRVAHLERQPYWTEFFVGDWKVGEMMAVNLRSDGTSAWNEVAYASASDTLRVRADGTYEWKDLSGKVTKGRWRAAPDGPGIVVKDARGRDWTLRNETNITEERIRGLESARLYPSDRNEMSQAATRPLKR